MVEINKIIVGDIDWAKTLPKWLLDTVAEERLILGLGNLIKDDIEKVGDAEVCVYLSTLCMRQPLSHNHAEIYIFLASKILKNRGKDLEKFMEKSLEIGLNSDQERELQDLKGNIERTRGKIESPILDLMRNLKKRCDELPKNNLYRWTGGD